MDCILLTNLSLKSLILSCLIAEIKDPINHETLDGMGSDTRLLHHNIILIQSLS